MQINQILLYNKNELMKNLRIKKEVGIAKIRKQVASYPAKKLLATHYTGSISYYLCLLMQTQFQLGS